MKWVNTNPQHTGKQARRKTRQTEGGWSCLPCWAWPAVPLQHRCLQCRRPELPPCLVMPSALPGSSSGCKQAHACKEYTTVYMILWYSMKTIVGNTHVSSYYIHICFLTNWTNLKSPSPKIQWVKRCIYFQQRSLPAMKYVINQVEQQRSLPAMKKVINDLKQQRSLPSMKRVLNQVEQQSFLPVMK